jgi:hypothetical protein
VLMELLKNSMKATIAHWGRDLSEAPPIQVRLPSAAAMRAAPAPCPRANNRRAVRPQVRLSKHGSEIGIRVSDCAGARMRRLERRECLGEVGRGARRGRDDKEEGRGLFCTY